jgi:hypothetical protein
MSPNRLARQTKSTADGSDAEPFEIVKAHDFGANVRVAIEPH